MNPISKTRVMRLFALTSLTIIISVNSRSQALYPVSLDEKVVQSSLIVEGRVTEQRSFWNATHSMIYTANTIELSKVFKGTNASSVEVLTVGGSVEGEMIEASDLLSLQKGDIGIFFCYPNTVNLRSPVTGNVLYEVYSSAQGALLYNPGARTASAPFAHYENAETNLYRILQQKTGQRYRNINPAFKPFVENNTGARVMGPGITSYSPTTVNAGALLDAANNVITITGSGFGNSPSASARVSFDNPDDGPGGAYTNVAYNDPLMISWNDTQIRLRVPTKAGTGKLAVTDASGLADTAAVQLEVVYAVQTGSYIISSTLYTKELNLMNRNGLGGYTILYSNSTNNSGTDLTSDPALPTFQRALSTWKEGVGFNITEGGPTAIQQINPSDGSNVIMYDNAGTGNAPLASGVLAVCYSFSQMCSFDPVNYQAQKTEFDVVIRKTGFSTGTANFTIGPCPPVASNTSNTDLETVILHELGHAIGLGHINDSYTGSFFGQLNPGKLMNFAVVNSVKRSAPDYSAYAGALYETTPQANTYGSCGLSASEMVKLTVSTEAKDNCPVSFPSTSLTANTTVSFDLVHATSNRFVDPAYTQVRCDGAGTAVTNNAYYAFKTNNAGGILSMNVNGYSTTPAALASCVQIYAGIPVTGIRLALYQVSACPAAGAFPTPIACQTFTGNGNLTNIAGLAANTNYLLYVDGIENTKANFNITFTGSALPLRITDFQGVAYDTYNELTWQTQQAENLQKVILQRSADGLSFEDLTEISLSSLNRGYFQDKSPFAVSNYYRLAIYNLDGTKDYSNTVTLKRKDKLMLSAYPVPANDFLHVILTGSSAGRYSLHLTNALGQRIWQSTGFVNAGNSLNTDVRTSKLADGIYFLQVTDEKGTALFNRQVTVTH